MPKNPEKIRVFWCGIFFVSQSWSYWPDLNRRPADYERSSGLPLAGKQRFPPLSAGVFEEFGKPVMVFAPLSPQQFFLFWVSVWVKTKTISARRPVWVKMGQPSGRPICFPSGQELRRSKQRLRIPIRILEFKGNILRRPPQILTGFRRIPQPHRSTPNSAATSSSEIQSASDFTESSPFFSSCISITIAC